MTVGTVGDAPITKNVKVIEWLKADILAAVTALYKAFVQGSEDVMLDSLAGLIITAYLLGRRLGFGFSRLDLKVEAKLKQGVDTGHEMEEWFGDLSSLLRYRTERKRV